MSLKSYIEALEKYAGALEIGYNTGDLPENIVEITEAVTLAKDTLVTTGDIKLSEVEISEIERLNNDPSIKKLCADWREFADRLDRMYLVAVINRDLADERMSILRQVRYLLDKEITGAPAVRLLLESLGNIEPDERAIRAAELFSKGFRRRGQTITEMTPND